jgi:hypothetical protein
MHLRLAEAWCKAQCDGGSIDGSDGRLSRRCTGRSALYRRRERTRRNGELVSTQLISFDRLVAGDLRCRKVRDELFRSGDVISISHRRANTWCAHPKEPPRDRVDASIMHCLNAPRCAAPSEDLLADLMLRSVATMGQDSWLLGHTTPAGRYPIPSLDVGSGIDRQTARPHATEA